MSTLTTYTINYDYEGEHYVVRLKTSSELDSEIQSMLLLSCEGRIKARGFDLDKVQNRTDVIEQREITEQEVEEMNSYILNGSKAP